MALTQRLIPSLARSSALYRPLVSSNLCRGVGLRYASNDSKKQQPSIDVKTIGVPMDLYIQPVSSHIPPFYKNPKLASVSLWRRFVAFIKNTVLMKSKISPRFVEWRNLALETYVDTNHAFASPSEFSKKLDLVQDRLSLWVHEALKSRLASIPSGTKMTWKLLKFNSTPKIVSIQPLLLPGKPLTDIQIVYRIESRQRIARIAPGEKEPQVVESDVVDYAAFSFDASKTPARVFFAGTLFEFPAANDSASAMMTSMKVKGDIFRQPPPTAVPSNN
ncbi:hypothetical protein D0Z00_004220 [Geotrichum galactomycetum]|uniref:Uncharacterized protein n=1 Tax=Geotrichum galactomycetum TaxID=27317 RepID=A0ACB6UYZ7_9ASCO|nr:hypothetical protein D0Z00_004220 [Geotrichum candidum]